MEWTNVQSELESRCSGIMTKKSKRKNMQKLKENHKNFKHKVMYFEAWPSDRRTKQCKD